jgi:hypothetical protein
MKNNTQVTPGKTNPPALFGRRGACLGPPRLATQIHHASPGTGQNQESSCGMWRLMTHLDHERDAEKGLEQPGR